MRRGRLLLAGLAVLPACGGSAGRDPGGTPAGDGWATLAPMSEARQEVGVAALGDRIYVAGGFRADASTANTLEAGLRRGRGPRGLHAAAGEGV